MTEQGTTRTFDCIEPRKMDSETYEIITVRHSEFIGFVIFSPDDPNDNIFEPNGSQIYWDELNELSEFMNGLADYEEASHDK